MNRAMNQATAAIRNRSGRHRVAVLALDGVIPFELGIPARILGGVRGEHGEPLYEVITCAPYRSNRC